MKNLKIETADGDVQLDVDTMQVRYYWLKRGKRIRMREPRTMNVTAWRKFYQKLIRRKIETVITGTEAGVVRNEAGDEV